MVRIGSFLLYCSGQGQPILGPTVDTYCKAIEGIFVVRKVKMKRRIKGGLLSQMVRQFTCMQMIVWTVR